MMSRFTPADKQKRSRVAPQSISARHIGQRMNPKHISTDYYSFARRGPRASATSINRPLPQPETKARQRSRQQHRRRVELGSNAARCPCSFPHPPRLHKLANDDRRSIAAPEGHMRAKNKSRSLPPDFLLSGRTGIYPILRKPKPPAKSQRYWERWSRHLGWSKPRRICFMSTPPQVPKRMPRKSRCPVGKHSSRILQFRLPERHTVSTERRWPAPARIPIVVAAVTPPTRGKNCTPALMR
jgi:hypothetical protein